MTIPGYNPSIPTSKNDIAISQANFLSNFSDLYNKFAVNHVPLDDSTNPGNHSRIDLIQQKTSLSTDSQEISLYSKNVANQTEQVFMRYPANGKEFQLTQFQIPSVLHIPNQQILYFSYLPGGIVVYFGVVIPTGSPFNLILNPVICSNIASINFCPVGTSTTQTPLYPPNVKLINENGKFSAIQMIASFSTFTTPILAPQFFMIFGNI